MSILSSFIVNILLLFCLFSKSLEISGKNLIDSSNLKNESLPIILNDEEKNIINKRQVSNKIKKIVSKGGQQINNFNSDQKEQFKLLQQQLLSIQAQLQEQLQSIQTQLSFLINKFKIPQATTTLSPLQPAPASTPGSYRTTHQTPDPAATYTSAPSLTPDIRQTSNLYTMPTYFSTPVPTKFTTRSFSQPTTNFYINTNGYTYRASTPSGK